MHGPRCSSLLGKNSRNSVVSRKRYSGARIEDDGAATGQQLTDEVASSALFVNALVLVVAPEIERVKFLIGEETPDDDEVLRAIASSASFR